MAQDANDLNQLQHHQPPIKVLCPNSEKDLSQFVQRGGDIVLINENTKELMIAELKFRHKPINDNFEAQRYIDKLSAAYGPNLAIVIDTDTEEIHNLLMNYIKEGPSTYNDFYCFSEEELYDPQIIKQLKDYKIKEEFLNIVVRDASSFKIEATPHELEVEASMKLSLEKLNQKATVQVRNNDIVKIKTDPSFTNIGGKNTAEFIRKYYNNPADALRTKCYDKPEI